MKKKHEETYNFIKNFMKEHNYPPTLREIGKGLGLRSLNTVYYRIEAMEKAGLITRDSAARSIVIKGARYIFDGEN